MVRRDDADPASRIPFLGAGVAGLTGRGLGAESGTSASLGAACFRAALTVALDVDLGAASRRFGEAFFAADWGRAAARALAAGARARDDLLARFLEELTPEFSDLADRAWRGLHRHDGRLRRDLGHSLRRRVWNALRVNPDDPVMDATFLHHERADRGVAFEPPAARDLEPVARNDVSADQPGHGYPNTPDVRLDMRL